MEEKLDKTFFIKQSHKEADNTVKYWRTKTMSERLQAGYYLSLRAYGYDPQHPPKWIKRTLRLQKGRILKPKF
ncbi:MAG: hypothetical protein V3V14_07705 [Saprospiraceae bacterium]